MNTGCYVAGSFLRPGDKKHFSETKYFKVKEDVVSLTKNSYLNSLIYRVVEHNAFLFFSYKTREFYYDTASAILKDHFERFADPTLFFLRIKNEVLLKPQEALLNVLTTLDAVEPFQSKKIINLCPPINARVTFRMQDGNFFIGKIVDINGLRITINKDDKTDIEFSVGEEEWMKTYG